MSTLMMKPAQRPNLRNKVLEYIDNDTSIPAFPIAVQKISRMVAREDVEFSQVAEVAKLDPALAAKLLKLANSVAFGGRERITCLTMAMMRIGLRDIKNMTLSSGVLDVTRNLRVKIKWENYWKHNLLTARITESLMSAYVATSGEEYLAGLLHRVGVLFIQHYFPNEFEEIALRVKQRGSTFSKAEMNVLGITHAQIGSKVCERWKIDETIGTAVRYYENPRMVKAGTDDKIRLLSICIAMASKVAEQFVSNLLGTTSVTFDSFEDLPEWDQLQEFTPARDLDLNLDAEMETVNEIFSSLSAA